MEVKIPNKIKVTLTKADTDIATTGGLKGYFYVLNGSALFRSSDKVETVRISVPKYAKTFYFRGGSSFYGPDGQTLISAEFLFLGEGGTLLYHWKQSGFVSYVKEFPIPDGTVTIYAPHVTSMDAIMRFIYDELDVTDGVMNFDELQISMSRDGATAVFVSSELPTQFARKSLGYNLLVTEFANRGIRAKIGLKVYQRSPFAKPTYVYTPVISAAVDFSSYKQYRNYVEVSCEDATLNQLILSNGSNDYDILVSDLQTEGFTWNDLKTPQTGKIERLPQGKITGVYGAANVADRINVIETSVTPFPNAEPFVLTNQAGGKATYGAQFFYQRETEVANPEPTSISVSMNNRVDFKFTVDKSQYDQNDSSKDVDYLLQSLSVSAYLSVIKPDGSIVNIWEQSDVRPQSIETDGDSYVLTGSIMIDTVDIQPANYSNIAPGDKLAFYTMLATPQLMYKVAQGRWDPIIFTYEETQVTGDPAIVSTPPVYPAGRLLRAINPQVLLQKFLDRMADQPGRYKATINWRQDEATDYRLRLLAAESIAGYKTPYLHGNIKDFMNWMRVMGYEYEITGNEIIYRPREQFYTADQMINLTAAKLNDLTISPATNVLYATVKVGYEKQDYNDDYLDGLEANALFQYGTGIDALEGDMDLTSPYRADAIGIQLLYRDPETGETESDQRDNPDEDIFVVVLNKTGDDTVYTAVTLDVFDQLSGTYLKLPNALVSAPYMVRYNASVIGISTSRLTFASTTGNKDAKIEEVPINADITITEQLFKPVLYEFEAGAGKEFPVTTGLLAGCGAVAFTWQGKTLRGFVKDIIRDVVDSEAVTWQLYAIDTPTL